MKFKKDKCKVLLKREMINKYRMGVQLVRQKFF